MKLIKRLIRLLPYLIILTLVPLATLFLSPLAPVSAQKTAPVDHCLGQWEWVQDLDGSFVWEHPFTENSVGAFDFRTEAKKAPGLLNPGWSIFAYNKDMTGNGMICYGSDLTAPLTLAEVDTLGFFLGRKAWGSIEARNLRDALWELLTVDADPTGQDFARPLMPNHQAQLELWLGGQQIGQTVVDPKHSPEWGNIQKMIFSQYRDTLQKVQDGKLESGKHRRMLGGWRRQFNSTDNRLFIPEDLPNVSHLEPRTVHSDTFTYSNGGLVSVSSGAWEAGDNTFTVTSGVVRPDEDSTNTAYWATDFDAAGQMYSQVELAILKFNKSAGAVTSGVDAANWYQGTGQQDSGDDTIQIRIYVSDSPTNLDSQDCSCGDLSADDVVRLEQNGSSFEIFINDVSQFTASDSTHSTVQAGIKGGHPDHGLDNWEGGDFPEGEPEPPAAPSDQTWLPFWW